MPYVLKAAALIVFLAVLAVMIAPACNLAPSALRSLQAAAAVLFGIAASALALSELLHYQSRSRLPLLIPPPAILVQDTDCVRLC